MDVLIASNNSGKVERYRSLIGHTTHNVRFRTPAEVGIPPQDCEETSTTLHENAELKAHAYFGVTDLPILANDTGFWIEPEGLIDAPKRIGLAGRDEKELTQEEITAQLITFWKEKATMYGGRVNAAWREVYVLLFPDGEMRMQEVERPVILTNREHGTAHPQLPVRGLYISKASGKPALEHTPEDELLELRPIVDAFEILFA